MKYYSDLEKQIISLLIRFNENEQYNCLDNILFDLKEPVLGPCTEIHMFHPSLNQTGISFKNLNISGARHIQLDTIYKLYTTVNLFDDLISEKFLIYVEQNEDGRTKDSWFSEGYMPFDIIDKKLQEKLFFYNNGYFIPTDNLIFLVKNDFKNSEQLYLEKMQSELEKRTKQNQIDLINIANQKIKRNSWTTVVISIVAIIVPVISTMITCRQTSNIRIVNDKKIPIVVEKDKVSQNNWGTREFQFINQFFTL